MAAMKLYFSNGSCSLASHVALEEAGAKFDTHRLNLREGEQRKAEYLKINPKGKVPALQLDDGTILTENPAIISYVADTHPQAGLLAKPGEIARAKAQEWLAWCASSIHPLFGPLFGALAKGSKCDEAQRHAVQAQLDRFDQWLLGTFVLGEQFSAADAYTLVFTGWIKLFELRLGDKTRRSAQALLQRPAVQRAVQTQQLKFEL
jgi:glutathione S-transferase